MIAFWPHFSGAVACCPPDFIEMMQFGGSLKSGSAPGSLGSIRFYENKVGIHWW